MSWGLRAQIDELRAENKVLREQLEQARAEIRRLSVILRTRLRAQGS